jgi:misacylated tRNA(Ala) deacylase
MITPNKNYDPAMHSAEHILNQTMVRMFNCGRSISAHIEKKKSKCDYRFTRDLTEKEISEIEERVNKIIEADLNITERFLSKADAAGKFNLDKLPEDSGELIRVIDIGDYDSCPCSGSHVSQTKDIGTFKIISTDFDNSRLRIRYKLQDK